MRNKPINPYMKGFQRLETVDFDENFPQKGEILDFKYPLKPLVLLDEKTKLSSKGTFSGEMVFLQEK